MTDRVAGIRESLAGAGVGRFHVLPMGLPSPTSSVCESRRERDPESAPAMPAPRQHP